MMKVLLMSGSLAASGGTCPELVDLNSLLAPAVAAPGPTAAPESTSRPECFYELLCTDASTHGAAVVRVPSSIFSGAPVDPDASFQVLRFPVSAEGNAWWMRNPQEIPLPPATWGGLAGLVTVAGFGYVRRRRLKGE